ncbi:phage envelope protein [Chryseobacterium lactis]|uniref:DUF1398 domain-containing protein n=1 Tax=Chryseobacterium lactis TaxID=1241981 RepID=A0A3G6RI03_CHRLC|nr:DUF1398 family protein [Chryseobacterium lactis]AZA84294.1 DUF1398 domain-containing protein [Chryseobacterium lactis]AZB04682.1 DUF1398 domain-containing protein [Chryseobacterium lactis]PNW14413.1 phage envelope protein [Chryseobacterium lactis]
MKFTIKDIQAEHKKVKSGADFPQYIQAVKNLGVYQYTVGVSDGSTEYFDVDHNSEQTESKYDVLTISNELNLDQFKARLKLHQQGGTDYMTFCNDCAENGIKGWKMDLNIMTCTYLDQDGNEVLVEQIPG